MDRKFESTYVPVSISKSIPHKKDLDHLFTTVLYLLEKLKKSGTNVILDGYILQNIILNHEYSFKR